MGPAEARAPLLSFSDAARKGGVRGSKTLLTRTAPAGLVPAGPPAAERISERREEKTSHVTAAEPRAARDSAHSAAARMWSAAATPSARTSGSE